MAKNYYTPVKFDDEEEAIPTKEESYFPTKNELKGLIRTITNEINDLEAGKSKFSKYAITVTQNRTGPSPLINCLQLFQSRPNKITWETFLAIVEQEINSRVKDYFIEQFNLLGESNDRKSNAAPRETV